MRVAIAGAGAVGRSIAAELVYVLNHAEVSVIVAEDQEQVDKVLSLKDQLPHLRQVIFDLVVHEQGRGAAITMHQRRSRNGLTNPRIRASDEKPFHVAFSRAVTNRSNISSLNPWFTAMRKRAVPGGTVGGRIARTSNPAACNSRATATVRSFSPMIMGTIGESPSSPNLRRT